MRAYVCVFLVFNTRKLHKEVEDKKKKRNNVIQGQ